MSLAGSKCVDYRLWCLDLLDIWRVNLALNVKDGYFTPVCNINKRIL